MKILKEYERHMKICRKSPSTIRQYVNDVKLFCNKFKADIFKCSGREVDGFIEWLIDRKCENATLARKIASLKSFYGFLVVKGIVEKNPFLDAPKFKVPVKDQRVLSEEEIKNIFEVLEDYPSTLAGRETECIMNVMYYLGMRVFEVASLDVSSIALPPESSIKFLGKGGKQRILPLVNDKLICSLDEWMDFRKKFSDVEALFISRNISRISVRTIQRWIKKLGVNSGLGNCLTPHVLRRTFATHLLNKNGDIFTVSNLLGHESLTITRRYAKVTDKKQKDTLRLL